MTYVSFIDSIFQIRAKLVSKQATEERLEKVRKLRELKKFGKKVQQEVNIKRAKEKREMLDQVKMIILQIKVFCVYLSIDSN